MYRYDEFDTQIVRQRVDQFRGQVARRLAGELTEEEFRPLRLMNGLYLQLHAYMLRVAIPYGTLSPHQLRRLADIADRYDRGYGHLTTRQNIQFNWPELTDVPDILDQLADVGMHAIQTSGNCIRNVTSDPYAGVSADEIEDPRPTAELLRQWSTFHPEFTYLPRKFKIAVTGAPDHDRTVSLAHDIGIGFVRNDDGETGYRITVGGGLGRTPMLGKIVRDFLPKSDLLAYIDAVMRVYNRYGRRDNKYKARVKILVHETGIDAFRSEVEAEFERRDPPADNGAEEQARIAGYFTPPAYSRQPPFSKRYETARAGNEAFARWADTNLAPHKQVGYAIVNVSTKQIGGAPGDITSAQMRTMAHLAETYGFGELRITHQQNLVLPDVPLEDLPDLWTALREADLATDNIGLVTDIIACPGMDYCALATARSIPVAQQIGHRLADPDRQREIGPMQIKISGCINACGHHHVGHIGILGLEKKGEEFYQITLGGDPGASAAIGEIIGPGFAGAEVPDAIERVLNAYIARREEGETFTEAWRRLGPDPFREALYATH